MTTLKISVAQAAIDVTRISAELEEAQRDLALLDRLKSAPDRGKRLMAEQEKAIAAHKKAVDALARVKKDDRFVGFGEITVRDLRADLGLLSSTFETTYVNSVYDSHTRQSEPKSFTVLGFPALPDNVFLYLLEANPAKIPQKITSLYPSDPKIAFERYYRGLNKGYISA